jgi:hypothetical protein
MYLPLIAIGYVYLQLFLHYIQPYLDRCRDLHLCRESPHSQYWYNVNTLILSEEEEGHLIKRYAQMEKQITTLPDCAIGVGYNTCVDIGFRAVDLF